MAYTSPESFFVTMYTFPKDPRPMTYEAKLVHYLFDFEVFEAYFLVPVNQRRGRALGCQD